MKTAMQKLIERIEKQMYLIPDEPNLTERALYDSYLNCKNWAKDFLEKEKEQIMEAHEEGINDLKEYELNGAMDFDYPRSGEEYYNQKYNQNK